MNTLVVVVCSLVLKFPCDRKKGVQYELLLLQPKEFDSLAMTQKPKGEKKRKNFKLSHSAARPALCIGIVGEL
jgi:hypothetical protein